MVLAKAVCTATACRSFVEAARVLEITTGLKISPRHLQTLCHEVGHELVAERQARTEAFRQRPLNTPAQVASPPVPLAVVMVDGGRMQTRKPDGGPGVHDPCWRETKTALLLRMTLQVSPTDPQPDLPACFSQPLGTTATPTPSGESEPPDLPSPSRETLFRTGFATLDSSEKLGWHAAAAAEQRGFFTAQARAFVGDGQAYNWTVHRRHFGSFEPILDFVHAAEHIHAAARAAGVEGRDWVQWCWQGRVGAVLEEMAKRQSELAAPCDPESEPDHPWCVLRREQGYLSQNQSRMDYPRYRRAGLPITSSPIESWIKQVNQRVKGSEKFWTDGVDGEAILELRNAWLGDDERLSRHLESRPGHSCSRPRQPAARAA